MAVQKGEGILYTFPQGIPRAWGVQLGVSLSLSLSLSLFLSLSLSPLSLSLSLSRSTDKVVGGREQKLRHKWLVPRDTRDPLYARIKLYFRSLNLYVRLFPDKSYVLHKTPIQSEPQGCRGIRVAVSKFGCWSHVESSRNGS